MKKNKLLSFLAIAVFSFCLVLLAEYVQMRELITVFKFAIEKNGVVLFSTLILFLFTLSMIFITKSTVAGAAISGIFTYALSCVEFYKFNISGSHLVIEDLTFIFNAGDISGFAEITPQAHIFRAGAALVLLIFAMCFIKVPIPGRGVRSIAGAILCLSFIVAIVSPTSSLADGYTVLEFDTEPALTTMEMNERFESDGFLGFLSQNATEYIGSDIKIPDGYSKAFMDGLASPIEVTAEDKPNIVIIASESFADLREISDSGELSEAYRDLDRAERLASVGKCVLPTFGGYTVRSEFELLFGLPVMSMANVASPHSLLDEEQRQKTIVSLLAESGYKTTYIHPFDRTFYNRSTMYPQYGFDRLIFGEDFDLSKDVYRRYISDKAVLAKVKEELESEDKPSFLFAMTMQNHQPYVEEGGSISGELEYYLDGIEQTSRALYDFFVWLESFDEATVVLFVGDHFPFFTPQGGVYERLSEGFEYTKELYLQKYLLYSNYEDIEAERELVSLFYLPHILLDKTGAAKSGFISSMLDEMKKTPVYSIAEFDGEYNSRLDAITYDRTIGEGYMK